MPKINVLDKAVAERIAAGEVVERPASVIKELMENSIDAGATSITVEIRSGGITFMRVTDNGCGIAKEDVKTAFRSHATSKISNESDLDSISTLGFRGEALPSVASVARVDIMTRTRDEALGTRFCIEAGEETLFDDAGCPVGTTIVVRDLFYCTPARMKFLKKDVSEANAVAGVVDRIALSHPEISFRFIREGKQTLLTGGTGDTLTAAREIFGREFADSLIPAESETESVKVRGYVSKPHASRPNRNMQFFFINGRLVKTGTGSAALTEAYKNSVMVGKFPSCVLFLELSPMAVDVNVHPAKTEVRFSNEKAVFNAVYSACKNALMGDTSRAQLHPAEKPRQDFFAAVEPAAEQVTFGKKNDFWQHIDKNGNSASAPATPKKVERPPEADVPVRFSVTHVNAEPPAEEKTLKFSAPESSFGYVSEEEERAQLIPSSVPTATQTVSEPPTTADPVSREEPEHESVCDEAESNSVPEPPVFRLVGEAFKTYIIVEQGSKLLLIDKHAAHERMIYEKLKSENSERSAQLLLAPVTVTLTKEEYSAALSNTDILSEAGFEIEDFGQGMVIVRECPMELEPDDINEVITELAGKFVEKRQDASFDRLDHIFHSVACRSAIKAGHDTSPEEMAAFVTRLLSMPEIRYCPHGRPVLIEMTQRELEKSFGRV